MKSQKTSCLKCRNCCEALVCSNQECPVVVHESCMPCAAHFDDAGSYHCPYCLYKQSLAEYHQAKEKALLAKKALVSFLDTRTKNDSEHPKNSNNLKRKKPEAKVDCNKAYQPLQVDGGQQDDSRFLEALSGNQLEAGEKKGQYFGKGSVAKDDGNLTRSCRVKEEEGYKSGRQEEVQTQAGLRKDDSIKEIHGKTDNKTGDCGVAYENILKLKSPKSDVFLSRENTGLVTQTYKDLTNQNKKTAKMVEGWYNGGVEREQMQTDPRKTPWCLTNKNPLEINEEPDKGNTYQDYSVVRTLVIENFDLPAGNGEDFIGRTDEGERKAETVAHPMRNNGESLPCGESGKSSIKDRDFEQAVAKFHDSAMENVQTHEEPKEISVFCIREDNATVISHKPDGIKDIACQDDYSVVMVNSENVKHYSRIGEDLCQRTGERWTNFKSPNKDDYPKKEYKGSAKHEKSGNSTKESKETSKPVEYYNGQAEEVQTREESQKGYVCLVKENATEITEVLDAIKGSGSRDDYFPRSERVENSENADHPDETGKDCYGSLNGITTQGNELQDPVHRTREDNAAVKHELWILTRQHPETKNKSEGYHNEVPEIEQTRSELQSTRVDNKQEVIEESDAENCNSFRDECFLKREIVMGENDDDRIACIGEDKCERTIETWLKKVRNAPQITRDESASVSYEEFVSVNDSESCTLNSEYLAYGFCAVEKRRMKKNLKNGVQLEESSGCSENEVGKYELSTHGKPRHKVKSIKQFKRSTILPAARRRKLPWTVQEVETLKKFSLMANKNLPWMKILEFGRHIFDGTRTPADLKDKWKNMKAKGKTNFDAN